MRLLVYSSVGNAEEIENGIEDGDVEAPQHANADGP